MIDPTTLIAGAKFLWTTYGDSFTDWLKEKAGDKAKDKALEYADKGWDKVKWHQAEKDYREKLAKLYGTTRILGNSEPTPLEGIFTDLYILDKPLAMRRYNLYDLQASDEKLYGNNVKREEGIAVIKQTKNSHRLFILGKPGAGKTTFLKYVTLQAVKGELLQTPIFVSLREWSEIKKKKEDKEIIIPLMEFIVKQFAICNFPEADSFIKYLLEKGKAILLLDGLDEVNSEHNTEVIKAVQAFCRKYDKTQCLITCRVAAVDYSFDAFKYMEVADFTDAQIETFVTKWFAKEPIKCEKFLTEFKQEQYHGVRELASSPLLLGMLCLAFADSMEFTTRRVDIYEDAIDALLRKWDAFRSISRDVIYQGLTHHTKKRLFAVVAYNTFNDNQYLIKEKKLANYLELCLKRLPNTGNQKLDGEVVLKAIEAQHGIFVERAQKIHSFAHLTFQEYFAACAIKGNLNYQKELMKYIGATIEDKRWREVFLLTASLLDDADDFFKLFKNAIDDLIRKNDKIVKFLNWIGHKANTIKNDYTIHEIYFFYLCLELNFDDTCDFSTTIDYAHNFAIAMQFDSTLLCAIDRSIEHSQKIKHTVNRIYNNSPIVSSSNTSATNAIYRTLDNVLPSTFNLNSSLADDIGNAFLAFDIDIHSHRMKLDFLLYNISLLNGLLSKTRVNLAAEINRFYQNYVNFYSTVIEEGDRLGFGRILFLLTNLKEKIPVETATQNEWQYFTKQFKFFLQNELHINNEWNFTREEFELLTDYFSANKLLLDCLKLSTVSNREAIKNSLFLPPNQ